MSGGVRMREIKFRAWDTSEKKMHTEISLLFANDLNGVFEGLSECGCIVMQYTGLKDKDCVEIYEGDVVRVMDSTFAIVKYSDDRGAYYLDCGKGIGDVGLICQYDTIKLVGNIYENPELMEV